MASVKDNTPEWEEQRLACARAQQTDYSCSALRNDAEYKGRIDAIFDCLRKVYGNPACVGPTEHDRPGSKAWDSLMTRVEAYWDHCSLGSDEDLDCTQARAALADFQNRVKSAKLNAELKDAFALVAEPSRSRSIVINQAPVTDYLTPPWVPSPPVFTTCSNAGITTNCVTH